MSVPGIQYYLHNTAGIPGIPWDPHGDRIRNLRYLLRIVHTTDNNDESRRTRHWTDGYSAPNIRWTRCPRDPLLPRAVEVARTLANPVEIRFFLTYTLTNLYFCLLTSMVEDGLCDV